MLPMMSPGILYYVVVAVADQSFLNVAFLLVWAVTYWGLAHIRCAVHDAGCSGKGARESHSVNK